MSSGQKGTVKLSQVVPDPNSKGLGQKQITKESFRREVWDHFIQNNLCDFPQVGHIPNFKTAFQAAAQLSKLEEFKAAKSIEVNPDKAVEFVRLLTLQQDKELYVPVPNLEGGFLKKLTKSVNHTIKEIVSRWGIDNTGVVIGLDADIHIDMIVVGSVAVSRDGYRIGKGKGFADLEYAILKEMNAVDDNTVIVTVVHDSQVYTELPKDLFKAYDVPVDYIVTPTSVMKVKERLQKPAGIFWQLINSYRLEKVGILKKLKERNESQFTSVQECVSSGSNRQKRRPRKNKTKPEVEPDDIKPETQVPVTSEPSTSANIPQTSPVARKKHEYPIDFSLVVGNIHQSVRVKDLKKALAEKGIKPDGITWKGGNGYCYLHYTIQNQRDIGKREPFSIDKVIEIIGKLKLTPECKQSLTVKVMEPITRIETTGVTSV